MIKRYERKFVFKNSNAKDIQTLVKLNQSGFHEIFHKRCIYNIYFDDLNFTNYYDNIDGVAKRVKYRIRWYDDFFSGSKYANLEKKSKVGLLVEKESFPLPNFYLNKNVNMNYYLKQKRNDEELNVINNSNLFPVLINKYKRRYFLSRNKNFRITIDSNIEASRIKKNINFNPISQFNEKIILELKYDAKHDFKANLITKYFHTRLNKNSKYVNAFEFLNI
ncbi:MAG: hypothetical protein CMG55_00540 [Candidatus Marinimicrobia bacterium]|nr:hypothetical protein [Candidatus Neomarinimicrobiota bacterium]|tara:strand:+ start:7113 stop:7775 length:663 start_codon:yes stop_codon:yes gene_type:complete